MTEFLGGLCEADSVADLLEAVSSAHCDKLLSAFTCAIRETGELVVGRKTVRHDGSARSWYSAELRHLRFTLDRTKQILQSAERDPLCSTAERLPLLEGYKRLLHLYKAECRRQRSLHEIEAQLELEKLDLPAERRLGQVQARGRPAEMQFLGDGDEAAEMAEFEHRSKSGIDLCAEQLIGASNSA